MSKYNKYHAQKVEFDGKRFDSRREARRYAELRLLERAGEITGLRTQVPFELIPAQDGERRAVMSPTSCTAICVPGKLSSRTSRACGRGSMSSSAS